MRTTDSFARGRCKLDVRPHNMSRLSLRRNSYGRRLCDVRCQSCHWRTAAVWFGIVNCSTVCSPKMFSPALSCHNSLLATSQTKRTRRRLVMVVCLCWSLLSFLALLSSDVFLSAVIRTVRRTDYFVLLRPQMTVNGNTSRAQIPPLNLSFSQTYTLLVDKELCFVCPASRSHINAEERFASQGISDN